MAFNGAGLFTRIYQWVNDAALGLNVDATRTDTDSNDIAAGLSNCVTRDGQSPWLNNLPAAGFKLTGLGSGMNAADSVNYGQVFNSPAFVTPSATTSPPIGDNSLRLATTAFAVQLAFSASLPGQPGGTTPYGLRSLGGVASWVIQTLKRSSRTSNTILAGADNASFVDITSGTFTQTFTAAATLGDGWNIILRNSGTGNITVDPNGGELIDGLTSYVMYPNESRWIQCDGVGFTSVVLSPFHVTFTISGTFIRPPGYSNFGGVVNSAGASGQRTNNAATASVGGCAGGAFPFLLTAPQIGASQTILIGDGGTQITGVAVGNPGGDTSIGSLIVVQGASFAVGGAVLTAPGVVYMKGAASGNAAGFESPASNVGDGPSAVWGGGAASSGAAASFSGSSIYGGGAGAGVDAAGVVRAAGSSRFAGNGGTASIAGNGGDGIAPSGGGGATQTGTHSGAGARGQVEIWGEA